MSKFNLETSKIENLDLKLNGKLPVNRDELLALVNSWGRNNWFFTFNKDGDEIEIKKCKENEKYDLSKLDVSQIKNFKDVFHYSNFEGDINSWDVSNATDMGCMFYSAKKFNTSLDKWNTSNVTSMNNMFEESISFNQPLNSWNTSKVIFMNSMFARTKNFNQSLDKWDVSNVIYMRYMFYNAENFNQSLNFWNISKVINITSIFAYTKNFNQPVLWDLSRVEICYNLFTGAKAFEKRFNNGIELPEPSIKIKNWLIKNRDKMIALDIEKSKGEELDQFLSNIDNKDIIIN